MVLRRTVEITLPPLTPLALSALSFPAAPQEPPVLNAYYEIDRGGLRLTAEVHHGVGPVFALLARADQNGGPAAVVDFAALDANGHGEVHAVFPSAVIQHLRRQGVQVQLSAAMWDGTSIFETDGDFPVGMSVTPSELDFDNTFGDDSVMVAGRRIAGQYQDVGLDISEHNTSGPDVAILFDSANPTGGDDDLRTRNPGAYNNTVPLGRLLIIAENVADANADDLIDVPDDDPDDEAAGGRIEVTWDMDVTFVRTRVLDVDGGELDYLRLYDAMDNEIYAELIPDAPDRAVQRIAPMVPHVRRAVLELGGSGALSRIIYCPDPTTN